MTYLCYSLVLTQALWNSRRRLMISLGKMEISFREINNWITEIFARLNWLSFVRNRSNGENWWSLKGVAKWITHRKAEKPINKENLKDFSYFCVCVYFYACTHAQVEHKTFFDFEYLYIHSVSFNLYLFEIRECFMITFSIYLKLVNLF